MANTTIVLNVHWEGKGLDGVAHLARMRREFFPQVPMTHYMSAAYFARGGSVPQILESMLPAFQGGDEVALHLPAWRSVRGVTGSAPASVIRGPDPELEVAYPGIEAQLDAGYTLPISAYPASTIDGFIQNSRFLLRPLLSELVKRKGLHVDRMLKGIRAGHGAATDRFLQRALSAGFLYDGSGVDSVWAGNVVEAGHPPRDGEEAETEAQPDPFEPLVELWSRLWGNGRGLNSEWSNEGLLQGSSGAGVSSTTQPLQIADDGQRRLLEFPLNGGVIPPFAPEECLRSIHASLNAPLGDRRVVSFAIRQETAEDSLNVIASSELLRDQRLTWSTNVDLLLKLSAQASAEAPAGSNWQAVREHFRKTSNQPLPVSQPASQAVSVPPIQIPRIETSYR